MPPKPGPRERKLRRVERNTETFRLSIASNNITEAQRDAAVAAARAAYESAEGL